MSGSGDGVVSSVSEEGLLSLEEAIRFLNTSKPTLYRLLKQGDIKAMKAGRQWRFRKEDLLAYTQRDTVGAGAPSVDVSAELAFFESAAPVLEAGEQNPGSRPEVADQTEVLDPSAARIARLAQLLVVHALSVLASDIHLEPAREGEDTFLLLRYRVDGMLQEIRRMPLTLHESLIQRFKLMAEMNLTERRLPQDGRVSIRHQGKVYDLRMAILPTIFGEALTMRILDRSAVLMGLEKLGMYPEDLSRLKEALRQPQGLIVTTGPTGSGKSTLLYSCLHALADGRTKVLTIEDPVEYQLPFVTQSAVNRKVGLTFGGAIRAMLRQDPDVVMSSEVRDLETAERLIETALTGHLVLTALHPNVASETPQRLIDMGIEPFLVAQTLVCVIGQRLVRRICLECKAPVESSPSASSITRLRERAFVGGFEIPDNAVFYEGRGCEACRNTGYRGRIGLFEVLPIRPIMRNAIARRAPAEEISQLARGLSPVVRSLVADGARKAVDGLTTVEEVLRAAPFEGG